MKSALLVIVLFACAFAQEDKISQPFSADVEKMMQIITSSLYQNREVFLREVVSNSADAMMKWRTLTLRSGEVPSTDVPLEIKIAGNKDTRTLTITDAGIGMTKEELTRNLGSLALSGTKEFTEKVEAAKSTSFIGQFGVGFYSVFLVADNVKVASKSDNSTDQYVWESNADGKFSVYKDPRGTTIQRGTEITLELKQDADSFLQSDELKRIVAKYSEFIDYPIYVQVESTEKVEKKAEEKKEKEDGEEAAEGEEKEDEEDKDKEEEKEQEEVKTFKWDLVNEQKPIWTRNPEDITKEEYNAFYKAITKEYDEPLYYSHFTAEGEVEFKSILYIPGRAPHNLFDHTSGTMSNVRLYVRRVFITDEFKDLLPRYLNFIKGVVDSDDLPLNVSREVLQENRLLKIIKKKLVRKALQMFKDIADEDEEHEKKEDKEDKEDKDDEADEDKKKEEKKEDEDKDEGEEGGKDDDKPYEPKYPKFWKEFGKNLRLGLIEDNSNRARLTKLLRYYSSKSENTTTSLEDYVERMPESQKGIFFLVGESVDRLKSSPLIEQAKALDVEVLYMTEAIDEYVVGHMTEFSGHKLISLAKEGTKFKEQDDKEKKIEELRSKAWEPFTKWLKSTLGEKIDKAVVSTRIVTTPAVVVATQYGISGAMEKIMKSQALADSSQATQKARRILEVNPRHPMVDELRRRSKENPEDPIAKDMAFLLYSVANMQSDFLMEDPNEFATTMYRMMKQGLNIDVEAPLVEEEEYDLEEEDEDDEGEEEGDEENDEDKDEKSSDEL